MLSCRIICPDAGREIPAHRFIGELHALHHPLARQVEYAMRREDADDKKFERGPSQRLFPGVSSHNSDDTFLLPQYRETLRLARRPASTIWSVETRLSRKARPIFFTLVIYLADFEGTPATLTEILRLLTPEDFLFSMSMIFDVTGTHLSPCCLHQLYGICLMPQEALSHEILPFMVTSMRPFAYDEQERSAAFKAGLRAGTCKPALPKKTLS